ncbi:MAG: ComEA family DNA-binding protein [Phocaeicola sp.]
MWKDYFYYTKGERRVLLFLMMIVLILVGMHTYSFLSAGHEEVITQEEFNASSDEMTSFLASITEKKEEQLKGRERVRETKRKIIPTRFDPNQVDSLELDQMGLPTWLIHRILNYRRAGKVFSTPESVVSVYGMTDELFALLKPYVVISESYLPRSRKATVTDSLFNIRDSILREKPIKYAEGTLVDLNRADTTELKKIPGIGSTTARRLLSYREALGGFYAVSQLEELSFIAPDLWVWFEVSELPAPYLDGNKASLDRLRNHPYLNFYQAKVILEHRRKRGKIKSLSQLSLYEEFTEKDLQRLSYYLKFD